MRKVFALILSNLAFALTICAQDSLPIPKPIMDLKPEKATYQAKFVSGNQEIPLSITNEIKEENDRWKVTEIVKLSNGEEVIRAESLIEKKTLLPKKRFFKQGVMTAEFEIKNGKAIGTLINNGKSKPVNTELGGGLFADGAGSFNVISRLPLKQGYTAKFRNFDVENNKIKMMEMKVAGLEKVKVPAGEFEAFKVIVTSDSNSDVMTYWFEKKKRQLVRVLVTFKERNASTVSELISISLAD